MKKIALFAAALVAVCASAAETASDNIVGYTKVTLDKAWTIVAVNFANVGDAGALSIQDAFPYAAGMTKGNSATAADNLQIQNAAGGYDIYYLSNGKNAKGKDVDGLDGKWAKDGTFVASTDTVSAGQAMWFGAKNPASTVKATVAGEVLATATAEEAVNLSFKHIANPFATDLPLNDGIPYVTGMTKSNSATTADNVQIQNAAGGYDIYYLSNGKNAKGKDVDGLDGKWAKDGTFVATDAAIPMGKGAWYIRRGADNFTITIARPFSVAE